MRRLVVLTAVALLVLALVPLASAATTSTTTKHVDGTVMVHEPLYDREWLARFEVRTTPAGTVKFGYLHLYGITDDSSVDNGNNGGAIHEFGVNHVDYYKTATGQGATLYLEECIISNPESEPAAPSRCFASTYRVSDGSPDTFLANLGWTVESGNVAIYTTSG